MFRKEWFASGYSLTSCGTPTAVSASSSRCAAPRRLTSFLPKLPTIGHEPERNSSEYAPLPAVP